MAGVRKGIVRATDSNKHAERLCEKQEEKSEALYEGHCEPEFAEGAKPVSATPALIASKSKRNKGRNIPFLSVICLLCAAFSSYLVKSCNKKLPAYLLEQLHALKSKMLLT